MDSGAYKGALVKKQSIITSVTACICILYRRMHILTVNKNGAYDVNNGIDLKELEKELKNIPWYITFRATVNGETKK